MDPPRTPGPPRRLSPIGFRALILAGAAALVLTVLVALGAGAAALPIPRVAEVLLFGGSPTERQIVLDLRLPRALLGLLVGSGLGVVGATLQSAMKSPLADPYILGISAGASVGAALAGACFGIGQGWLELSLPIGAFLAALLSAILVYGAARVGGRVAPIRLLLAGVAYSSFASAVTGFILFVAPEEAQLRGFLFWTLGGLGAADWETVRWTAALALPGVVVLMLTARWQNLLLLGDEAALSLGLDAGRARGILVLLSAVVTGTIVAAAGAIGFVGLIVPHAVRWLTGPDHRRVLIMSGIGGAMLLIVMDALARDLFAPRELPVGLLTGLLGAPFFLILLRRQDREHG